MAQDENPSAFKHWIDAKLLRRMANAIHDVYKDFDSAAFVRLSPELLSLELKPRVRCIRDHLKKHLPQDYKKALRILLESTRSKKLDGFDLWPYTEFIQTYGLKHPELSLQALRQLTQLFTGEFAVRPFIKQDPTRALAFLLKCAQDKDTHIRRWASEGSRPRLPWGEKLQLFIDVPHRTLPLLEKLKYDSELYVRKSVANHLNDIAKDHPEFVVKTLQKWKTKAPAAHQPKIEWILHRSLRVMIKNGHPGALKLAGVDPNIRITVSPVRLSKTKFRVGDKMEFEFQIQSRSAQAQPLIVDYMIHHRKANGGTSIKVFKLKKLLLPPRARVSVLKNHSLKEITTRVYYRGIHFLEIQINGKLFSKTQWELV